MKANNLVDCSQNQSQANSITHDEGIIIVFKGERKNLRGKYRIGTCIITPKGLFLFSKNGWAKLIEENSKFDFKTGKYTTTYRLEHNKAQKGEEYGKQNTENP